MAYLDLPGLKGLTIAPAVYVDEIELIEPGWVANQLAFWSSWIDARLAKRYQTPFPTPYPIAVTGWLSRLVTQQLYLKRGVDPTDRQASVIQEQDKEARAEIQEAADAVDGRFELPLRQGDPTDGVSKGFPLGYAEPTAYDWTDAQRLAAEAFGTFSQ